MPKLSLPLVLAATLIFALPIAPAQAQNNRSWVANFGSDGNLCTEASPCATFGRALMQTNATGEINCLTQGDFGGGGFEITQSVTIDCEGVQARVVDPSPAGTAITIIASTSDVVVLRGLDISGNGVDGTGISVGEAAAVHIEKCAIHDFGFGWGIVSGPISIAHLELFVSDSVIENNGSTGDGGGILVELAQPDTITKLLLNRVEVRNNFFGIKADGTKTTGGVINMTVRDSVSAGNKANGIVGTGTASGPAILMMVDHSTSSHNAAGFGVIADGPKTEILLTNSTVSGNINGLGASNGGALISYQNNNVALNSTDGNPTGVRSFK